MNDDPKPTVETAVCLDLDGTLVRYEQSYGAVTAGALEAHLGTATEDMVVAYSDAFVEAFESLASDPYHAGMRAALDHAGEHGAVDADRTDDANVDDMVATLRDREFAAGTVTDAARDCLDALAADGDVCTTVVTDGVGDWQRAKLAHHDLADAVDGVVVSYDVGGHKADGDPYEAVRERIAAGEYVMVGDSYESDVEAARAAGFVPVHYEDDGADLFEILRAFL